MDKYLIALAFIIAAYFIGSILFAYIITKALTGKDIRQIGNKNPGASNTMRSVGAGAGIAVTILDMLKALVPIIVARIFFFKTDSNFDWIVLFLIGMSAVLGHCRPFWMGFKKGGGGMATTIGVWAFFVPVEFLISLVLGTIISFTAMKNAEFKFGRWAQMFGIVLTPIVILVINQIADIPLFLHFSIGGHNLGVIIGAFLLLIEMFILNSYELFHWLRDPKDTVNPDRTNK
jgi:acyl-phosphate glycerol 3-phosphate acyltransferase